MAKKEKGLASSGEKKKKKKKRREGGRVREGGNGVESVEFWELSVYVK